MAGDVNYFELLKNQHWGYVFCQIKLSKSSSSSANNIGIHDEVAVSEHHRKSWAHCVCHHAGLATFKDEKQALIIQQKHNHEHLTAPDCVTPWIQLLSQDKLLTLDFLPPKCFFLF